MILMGWAAAGMLAAAAPAPAVTPKPPAPAAAKPKPAPPKPKPVMVDDFEAKAMAGWFPLTRERKEQPDGSMAFEQTVEDRLALTLTSEKKWVKSGTQALRILYQPAREAAGKEALVGLRETPAQMEARDAVTFWANVAGGAGTFQVSLLDKTNFARFYSKPVACDWKGWKQVKLGPLDFGLDSAKEAEWKEWWASVKRLQFVLHAGPAGLDLVLDRIEYAAR